MIEHLYTGPAVIGLLPSVGEGGDSRMRGAQGGAQPLPPLIRPSGTFSHGGEKAMEPRLLDEEVNS